MSDSERAAVTTLVWTSAGVLVGLPLLAVPVDASPLIPATVHLAGIVAFGIALTFRLAPLTDRPWFTAVSSRWQHWLTAVWAVVLVTGAVGLVALATSAALRYDPSMQYLQLLSAADIAWSAAALGIGLRWWRGLLTARIGVGILAVVCIWSIWRYLEVVGFGPGGSWVVDGSSVLTLVLPYDIAAAVMALGALWLGAVKQRAAS